MKPYHLTVLLPGAGLGPLALAFAASYLYGSHLSAGWAQRRYPVRSHTAKHRRTVTA